MSGNDGLRTDSIYGYSYGYNHYLGDMSRMFTRELAFCPAGIWRARNYTQAWNVSTYLESQPYGLYFNWTGRPHYQVANSFEVPYEIAAAWHGYGNGGAPTAQDTAAKLSMHAAQSDVTAGAINAAESLKARPIGQWKDAESLKDEAELKQQVTELQAKIDAVLKQMQETTDKQSEVSFDIYKSQMSALTKIANGYVTEADALYKKCKAIDDAYAKKVTEEAAAKARAEAEAQAAAAAAGSDPNANLGAGQGTGTGTGTETVEVETPVAVTSVEKTDVQTKGTAVKVKPKGGADTDELAGEYYKLGDKIYYLDPNKDKPVDITSQVDEIKPPAAS